MKCENEWRKSKEEKWQEIMIRKKSIPPPPPVNVNDLSGTSLQNKDRPKQKFACNNILNLLNLLNFTMHFLAEMQKTGKGTTLFAIFRTLKTLKFNPTVMHFLDNYCR
jgi:hypothetical protein